MKINQLEPVCMKSEAGYNVKIFGGTKILASMSPLPSWENMSISGYPFSFFFYYLQNKISGLVNA